MKSTKIIPEDFKDFSVNSVPSEQQRIISSLLELSTQTSSLDDKGEKQAISCPHCGDAHIRANGKLKGVQRYVQNVNNMDMRLRKFMAPFNGVASKYLQNYLNWFLVLEKIKKSTDRMTTVAAIAFDSNTAWMDFKNKATNNMLIGT